MFIILTAKYNDTIINCYDGKYSKEELKRYAEDNLLFCPVCSEPYMYCHGNIRTPYFRHENNDECIYRYHEPETEEHLQGKIALFEWIKTIKDVSNPIMECWMPVSNQRPDIAFRYKGEPYVIEYQCSPISAEYHDRHNLYCDLGVTDIWICGTNKYLEKEEVRKKFRLKEIENNTKYYYDSKHNIFILVKDEEEISLKQTEFNPP